MHLFGFIGHSRLGFIGRGMYPDVDKSNRSGLLNVRPGTSPRLRTNALPVLLPPAGIKQYYQPLLVFALFPVHPLVPQRYSTRLKRRETHLTYFFLLFAVSAICNLAEIFPNLSIEKEPELKLSTSCGC